MFVVQVALVSDTKNVDFAELARVSAALQKQAMRDLGPLWDVQATVDAFAQLEDVPLGYWPIIVADQIPFNAAGIHLDKDGQPYALVKWGPEWSLTASHELVEMLVDPFGNRLIAGPSLHPDQGRVEYLVEVADPSEAGEFGYTVNGILMSDFYTQRFFDPVESQGVQYSFTGALTRPREVLFGGYISWHEPISDEWWQLTWFGGHEPEFVNLGRFTAQNMRGSLRATIDYVSVKRQQKLKLGPFAEAMRAPLVGQAKASAALRGAGAAPGIAGFRGATAAVVGRTMRGLTVEHVRQSTTCKAQSLRKQIQALVKSEGGGATTPKVASKSGSRAKKKSRGGGG